MSAWLRGLKGCFGGENVHDFVTRVYVQTGSWNVVENPTSRESHFKQVGTTMNGKSISETQHDCIVESIRAGLELQPRDRLLDMCCGNGILTADVGKHVAAFTGVDLSDTLLAVAKEHYCPQNGEYKRFRLLHDDPRILHESCAPFNKFILYAALQFFTIEDLRRIFQLMRELSARQPFSVYLGGIPDRGRIWSFYRTVPQRCQCVLRHLRGEHDIVGVWFSYSEIEETVTDLGGACILLPQDASLHNAHFRFDVVAKFNAV